MRGANSTGDGTSKFWGAYNCPHRSRSLRDIRQRLVKMSFIGVLALAGLLFVSTATPQPSKAYNLTAVQVKGAKRMLIVSLRRHRACPHQDRKCTECSSLHDYALNLSGSREPQRRRRPEHTSAEWRMEHARSELHWRRDVEILGRL